MGRAISMLFQISRKKKVRELFGFAFKLSLAWKLKSPQRWNLQSVTVNSSMNAENSEKNLSTVKPFFQGGGGWYTVTRQKTLLPEVRVKSKCLNTEKIQLPFCKTWSPLRAITANLTYIRSECMDVHANPDLQSLRLTPVTWSIYSCKAHTMRTAPICHHLRLARFIADKNYLIFVPKSIMTRNSGLVSGDLMQTGF